MRISLRHSVARVGRHVRRASSGSAAHSARNGTVASARHPVRIAGCPVLVYGARLLLGGDFGVDETQVTAAKGHTRLVLAHLLALRCSRRILLHHVAVGEAGLMLYAAALVVRRRISAIVLVVVFLDFFGNASAAHEALVCAQRRGVSRGTLLAVHRCVGSASAATRR